MPSSKAEKKYNGDLKNIFEASKKALEEMSAKITSSDEEAGVITAIKKFHLIKSAKLTITLKKIEYDIIVTAESAMSLWTMGAIDIGKNAKFVEDFFSKLDKGL